MTTTTPAPLPDARRRDEVTKALTGGSLGAGRRFRNGAASVLMVLAFLVAAVPLAVMGAQVFSQGVSAVTSGGWWTNPIPETGRADLADNQSMNELGFGTESGSTTTSAEDVQLGMGPAIVGTLLTVLGASLLAIPLGIMGAVYLHEYGKTNRLAKLIRFMTDVMTGVPSVIMGVFIYTIWVLPRGVDG